MKSLKNKLKHLFFPFMLMGAGYILVYLFFVWLLCIKYTFFELHDEMVGFVIPLILLGILSSYVLKPRIELLKFKKRNKSFDYFVMASVLFVIPTFIAHEYLIKVTGKLTHFTSISSIAQQDKVKFYSIDRYYPSAKDAGVTASADVTGKYNDKMDFSLYITVPLYDTFAEREQLSTVWMGVKYAKTVSYSLSDHEIERAYEAFIAKAQEDFHATPRPLYFDRIGRSNDLTGFKEALKKSSKFHQADHLILAPQFEPFETRAVRDFKWILFSFAWSLGIWLVMILFPSLDEEKVMAFAHRRAKKQLAVKEREEEYDQEDETLLDYLTMLKPTRDYFVTPILLITNITIFVIMTFSVSSFSYFLTFRVSDLLEWGANEPSLILQGEYLRLLTSSFLHSGIYHLTFCMFALYYIGSFIEFFVGKRLLIGSYIFSALAASMASFYFSGAVSVGSSGAILGVYGVSLVLMWRTSVVPEAIKNMQLAIIGFFAGATLLSGFIYSGIDNAAHIGGFLSGCLLGCLIALCGNYSSAKRSSQILDVIEAKVTKY